METNQEDTNVPKMDEKDKANEELPPPAAPPPQPNEEKDQKPAAAECTDLTSDDIEDDEEEEESPTKTSVAASAKAVEEKTLSEHPPSAIVAAKQPQTNDNEEKDVMEEDSIPNAVDYFQSYAPGQEDDPIPPYMNPAGVYETVLVKKRKRDEEAKSHVPYGPKSVGSITDQTRQTRVSCGCKLTRCLNCSCFAAGQYCNENCGCGDECQNNPDKKNAASRHSAIQFALHHNTNAFRRYTKQRCNKAHCSCFSLGVNCVPASCRCKKCHAIPESLKIGYAGWAPMIGMPLSRETVDMLPLKVNGRMIPGIAFIRADKKKVGDETTTAPMGMPKQATNPNVTAAAKEPPELQVDKFFRVVEQNLSTRGTKNAVINLNHQLFEEGDSFEKETIAVLDSVEQDVRAIKKVVEAAKEGVITRFYKETKKKKRSDTKSVTDESDESDEIGVSDLLCEEELNEPERTANLPSDQEELRRLIIGAAQDAAILQETARILRRKARELCMQRSRMAG